MKRTLLPLLATALLVAGCGSDDESGSTSQAASTPATTSTSAPAPTDCGVNADGKIRSIDKTLDRGFIEAKNLGKRIRFRPSKDFKKGKLPVGSKVFFNYTKTSGGGTATCIVTMS